jgi:hypothetical protein
MPTPCTHLDQAGDIPPRTPNRCEACPRAEDRWSRRGPVA